jgi:hypothetical protein
MKLFLSTALSCFIFATAISTPASGHENLVASDANIATFLQRLKTVLEGGLINEPARAEAIFGFRLLGWREASKDNYQQEIEIVKGPGSISGLFLSLECSQRAPLPVCNGLRGSRAVDPDYRILRITKNAVEKVFGLPIEQSFIDTAHGIVGVICTYRVGVDKGAELRVEYLGGRNAYIMSISARIEKLN